MRERDLRFASWVISVTSVLYGIISLLVLPYNGYSDGYYGWELVTSNYLHIIPFVLLIIFGIGKMIGITFDIKLLKRVSIVGMMFCWGFVWTSSIVNFFLIHKSTLKFYWFLLRIFKTMISLFFLDCPIFSSIITRPRPRTETTSQKSISREG